MVVTTSPSSIFTWNYKSLFVGIYYYIQAATSTLYLLLLKPIWSTFKSFVYKQQIKQAKKRGWEGFSRLPAYQHQRLAFDPQRDELTHSEERNNIISSDVRIEPQEGKYFDITQVPQLKRTIETIDGLTITYYVYYPGNPKAMVFATGLGCSAEYIGYAPMIYRYGKENGDYSFITWDYRGLFRNTPVKRTRRLAIHYHAEDLASILEQEGRGIVDVLCGFSMGVQVVLEFASLYPEKVQKMILFNGGHGKLFESAFQPFFRIPFASTIVYNFINFCMEHVDAYIYLTKRIGLPLAHRLMMVYSFLFGNPMMRELIGQSYLEDFMVGYLGDVVHDREHCLSWFRLFLELHAHSLYHKLDEIEHPTLIVAGLLDPLTPAYLSFEMHKLMKNSRLLVCDQASHAALTETPDIVFKAVIELIEESNPMTGKPGMFPHFTRVSSTRFEASDPSNSPPPMELKADSTEGDGDAAQHIRRLDISAATTPSTVDSEVRLHNLMNDVHHNNINPLSSGVNEQQSKNRVLFLDNPMPVTADDIPSSASLADAASTSTSSMEAPSEKDLEELKENHSNATGTSTSSSNASPRHKHKNKRRQGGS